MFPPSPHPSVSSCRSLVWLWVKRVSLALCVICLMVPIVAQLPEMIRQRLYYHRSELTPGHHSSNPKMQKRTVNMYLRKACSLIWAYIDLFNSSRFICLQSEHRSCLISADRLNCHSITPSTCTLRLKKESPLAYGVFPSPRKFPQFLVN